MFNKKTKLRIADTERRLRKIENILLEMTDVIDMAKNFEERMADMEGKLEVVRLLPIKNG